MASELKIIKGANLFCDDDPNESNHLRLDEVGLSDLTRVLEEHRPGGGFMALEVDMNMYEALAVPFTLKGFSESMLTRVGLGDGNYHNYTIFKEIQDVKTQTTERLTVVARGLLASAAQDAYNKRGMSGANYEVRSIQSYFMSIGDRVIFDFDFFANRRIVGGVDQSARSNAILGIV